jgi:CheY-like chemotaxis protein
MVNPSIKLLYVEDEDVMRSIVMRMFAGNSAIDAMAVRRASDAIELMEKEDFDIIILDWWLQDPDTMEIRTSEEILNWMNSHNYFALTVVFTSTDIDEKVTNGVAVIRKDLRDMLRRKIEEVVDQKKTAVEALDMIRKTLNRMTIGVR